MEKNELKGKEFNVFNSDGFLKVVLIVCFDEMFDGFYLWDCSVCNGLGFG